MASPKVAVKVPSWVRRSRTCRRKQIEKKPTDYDKYPLPTSDPVHAIEMLDCEGQETREGASERGDAKHCGDAELHGMTLIESRKEEHNTRYEAT